VAANYNALFFCNGFIQRLSFHFSFYALEVSLEDPTASLDMDILYISLLYAIGWG